MSTSSIPSSESSTPISDSKGNDTERNSSIPMEARPAPPTGPPRGPPPGQGPPPELILPKWRLSLLSFSLCLGLFMSFLDSSITATALVTIGTEFGSLSNINWIALAYTLSDVGCAVLFPSIGDVVGRRNAYLVAYVIFFAFSIGCGFAQTIDQLIVLRALQGIGGSGLYSLAMVIFPEIFPRSMKKWIGAIAGMIVSISGVMGPILGGIITHYTTWRWIFWINAPIGLVSFTIFVLAWPKKNQMNHAERRPLGQLDFLGSFLLIAASVLCVFAFQQGGVLGDAWGRAIFIAPLVVGAVCWLVLLGWEVAVAFIWKDSVSATFPSSLLKRRIYTAGALTTLFTGFPYFIVVYNIPLHLQIVNGRTPLIAGIGLLPLLGSTAMGSMLAGFISGKKNFLFQTLTVGTCLLTLGCGLLSTVSGTMKIDPKIYGFEVLVGLGFGLSVSTSSIIAATECELKDHAIAQGLVAQARVLGGSFGIAASTAIFGVIKSRELSSILSQTELVTLDFSLLNTSQAEAVRRAYSDAFSKTLQVAAIVSAISILWAVISFRKNPPTLAERTDEQLKTETARRRAIAMAAMQKRGRPGEGQPKKDAGLPPPSEKGV